MKWLPGPETRAAVVSNPVFLAGLAVVVLLGLTAATLVVVDSVRGSSGGGTPAVAVQAMTTTTVTPGPVAETAAAGGVTGTTNRVAAVRQAPGPRTPVLGTLDINNDVVIDGRSADSKWLRVIFPPDSELHGWISADSLDLVGDPATLVVATAEPPVVVDLPTEPPAALTAAAAAQRTPTPATSVTPTPTVNDQLPDLAVDTTPTLVDGKLFVTVVNQGKGAARGDLTVMVLTEDGSKVLGGATVPVALDPGHSIDIGTGYTVTENQTLLIVINANGTIKESDDSPNSNNRVTISISLGGPVGTPTSEIPTEAPPTETPAP